ncbi:adenylate cyclase [Rhodococcus sp. Leaf7]|uniref:adenylate/guanylate cyclase domain-containing protein n=1 Tax=unclassified Rhodococcus (in: high G+C Gram-positive bacteria) TaxID=192944 RepID=UPI0006FD97D9|nr:MULTISPECIES: adenylate/guanylate cyclase domain-containing protein [unclassified Rhodococcus (in: high G+C Gram-positive bacteria)]KQU04429.1 adenylate cyclase [Rhodococcus sp. Leaf7]KQU40614.1 adenylate cyclase [Rhodococcus sp. Leaf247]
MTDHDNDDVPRTFRQADVEQTLLGEEAKFSRDQVAERAGVDLERAQQLWVAMGFPTDPDPDVVMYTDADVDALKLITTMVDTNVVEKSMEVAVARTLGQSMSRLAEWQVGVVNSYIATRIADAEAASESDRDAIRAEARVIAAETVPSIEQLQNYVWRRHLAAASGRALAVDASGDTRNVVAVGFADMVGYTSLTRRLDVEALTSLLEEFESVATGIIARGHGSVVKNVGDEVMFQAATAADAARIALHLHEAFDDRDDVPALRVGIAVGPALARFGDLYGSVVNIAARLTSNAHPGTVLVDSETADALAGQDEFYLKSLRPLRVRGFSKLRTYALRWNKQREASPPS